MAGKVFISLRKAVQLTGKSERKLLKFWHLYQDTPKVKLKNGKRYISRLLLEKNFRLDQDTARHAATDSPQPTILQASDSQPGQNSLDLVKILSQQMEEKDRQLAAKDAQISQLIERNREQNNIIFSLEKNLQQLESKLAIPLAAHSERNNAGQAPPNYMLIALVVLLVGIILIIFYVLLAG